MPPLTESSDPRDQLAVGYTLLYQEANGIPKFNWLLLLKNKQPAMKKRTDDLMTFYKHLAEHMKELSAQYPALKLDVLAMSTLEADTRKAIGEDKAKSFAPLVGNSGKTFERKALLTFYDALDEQRHLAGSMLKLETDPGLRNFLESTKKQLESEYSKTETLLERSYFAR